VAPSTATSVFLGSPTTFDEVAMVRSGFLLLLLLALAGCGSTRRVAAVTPLPVTASDLSGQTFNVLTRNADESVILLGHLRFDSIRGTDVTGTWDLQQWSGPAAIPGLPGSGSFAGTLEASTLILKLPLDDPGSSLGVYSRGFVAGRLSGTLSLLPSLRYNGAFEAIRSDQG
jgi:hypothetical protein